MQVFNGHTDVKGAKRILGGVLISLSLLLSACGSETPDRSDSQDAEQSQVQAEPEIDAGTAVSSTDTLVVMRTSMGEIELALDAELAPLSVENFLAYAESGHYDGTVFHRVIPGFMVQGGGFDEALQQKSTRDPILNEAANGLKNVQYSLAMARTQVWDSATSQFFINVADNAFLDTQYAVFGQVVSGKDVIDQMAAVQTGASGQFRSDVPVDAIVIESVSLK